MPSPTMTSDQATELVRSSMPLRDTPTCAPSPRGPARCASSSTTRRACAPRWGCCTAASSWRSPTPPAPPAHLNLPEGAVGTTTPESKTNFLGAVRPGVATPLHVGGSTIVVESMVSDASGRRVAKTTQTRMVLPPR